MSNLIKKLSAQTRKLPAADRVRLAEELLTTVHEPDDEVDAAWDEKIRLRIADIDAGTAKLIPAGEVFAQVRRLLNWCASDFTRPQWPRHTGWITRLGGKRSCSW